MSGGSYDYLYSRVESMAENIPHRNNPRRVAFKKLLSLVADAMHAIEWVDSCDYAPGDEDEQIERCLKFIQPNWATIAKAAAFDEVQKMFEKSMVDLEVLSK